MKLLRVGAPGAEKPAMLAPDGTVRDLSGTVPDLAGDPLSPAGLQQLVTFTSHFMTLHPGDIISTGTPPGVGLGMKPPRFLRAGETMKLGIEGLGEQTQKVVA